LFIFFEGAPPRFDRTIRTNEIKNNASTEARAAFQPHQTKTKNKSASLMTPPVLKMIQGSPRKR